MQAVEVIQKHLLFVMTVLAVFLLTACNQDQHYHPELRTGKELYNYHCAACHNNDGSGIFLKGVPASIATNKNQTEIMLHITSGSQAKAAQMPVYANMPDAEAYLIANYLLQLKSKYLNNPGNNNTILLERQK